MTIQIQSSLLTTDSGALEVTAVLIATRDVEATGGVPGNWADREFKADFAALVEDVEQTLAGYDVDAVDTIYATAWHNATSDLSSVAHLAVEYHVRARIAKAH